MVVAIVAANASNDEPGLVKEGSVEHPYLVYDKRTHLAQALVRPAIVAYVANNGMGRRLAQPERQRAVECCSAYNGSGTPRGSCDCQALGWQVLDNGLEQVRLAHSRSTRDEHILASHDVQKGPHLLVYKIELLSQRAPNNAAASFARFGKRASLKKRNLERDKTQCIVIGSPPWLAHILSPGLLRCHGCRHGG